MNKKVYHYRKLIRFYKTMLKDNQNYLDGLNFVFGGYFSKEIYEIQKKEVTEIINDKKNLLSILSKLYQYRTNKNYKKYVA